MRVKIFIVAFAVAGGLLGQVIFHRVAFAESPAASGLRKLRNLGCDKRIASQISDLVKQHSATLKKITEARGAYGEAMGEFFGRKGVKLYTMTREEIAIRRLAVTRLTQQHASIFKRLKDIMASTGVKAEGICDACGIDGVMAMREMSEADFRALQEAETILKNSKAEAEIEFALRSEYDKFLTYIDDAKNALEESERVVHGIEQEPNCLKPGESAKGEVMVCKKLPLPTLPEEISDVAKLFRGFGGEAANYYTALSYIDVFTDLRSSSFNPENAKRIADAMEESFKVLTEEIDSLKAKSSGLPQGSEELERLNNLYAQKLHEFEELSKELKDRRLKIERAFKACKPSQCSISTKADLTRQAAQDQEIKQLEQAINKDLRSGKAAMDGATEAVARIAGKKAAESFLTKAAQRIKENKGELSQLIIIEAVLKTIEGYTLAVETDNLRRDSEDAGANLTSWLSVARKLETQLMEGVKSCQDLNRAWFRTWNNYLNAIKKAERFAAMQEVYSAAVAQKTAGKIDLAALTGGESSLLGVLSKLLGEELAITVYPSLEAAIKLDKVLATIAALPAILMEDMKKMEAACGEQCESSGGGGQTQSDILCEGRPICFGGEVACRQSDGSVRQLSGTGQSFVCVGPRIGWGCYYLDNQGLPHSPPDGSDAEIVTDGRAIICQ